MVQIFKTMIILLNTWLTLYQEYAERQQLHRHLPLLNLTLNFQDFYCSKESKRIFKNWSRALEGGKTDVVFLNFKEQYESVDFISNQEYRSSSLKEHNLP